MIQKFTLWAAGIVLVVILGITSYGVLSGNFSWEEYKTMWAGLAGTLLGYILKAMETQK